MQNKIHIPEDKKLILFLGFIALIFINILFRVPITSHEIGNDSFYIHELGQSIVDSGFITWSLSPLSLFGLYPDSYASGVPTIIAISSHFLSLDMETTIFFLSLFFGIFGIFSAYLLAGEFSDNVYFRFVVALIYSTGPEVLTATTWTMSSRGLFMMMFPLTIWAMLRFFERREAKYLLFFIILSFVLMTIHKTFIFIVPCLACIIAAYFIHRFFKNNPQIISKSIRIKIPWIYFTALSVLFIIPFFFINNIWAGDYISDYFQISGNTWYIYVFEMLFVLVKRYGFILLLAGLGTLFIFKNDFEKRVHHIFLVLVFLCIVPLFAEIMYALLMTLIFFSILAAFGFLFILSHLSKIAGSEKSKIAVIIIIISSLLIFSSFTQAIRYNDPKDAGYTGFMFDETFYLASFLQKETGGLPISGMNGQLIAHMHNSNNPVKENTLGDRQITVSLKPVPTNLRDIAAFIRSPFSTASSIKQIPAQNAYDISLNDRSVDSPDKMKIYCNGFEELWYLGHN